jgi:hypothetical protein
LPQESKSIFQLLLCWANASSLFRLILRYFKAKLAQTLRQERSEAVGYQRDVNCSAAFSASFGSLPAVDTLPFSLYKQRFGAKDEV